MGTAWCHVAGVIIDLAVIAVLVVAFVLSSAVHLVRFCLFSTLSFVVFVSADATNVG